MNKKKKKKKNIKPVANIINSAFQSTKGRNFAGLTDLLTFGGETVAWGRLVNPPNSKVCLFFDFFTLTNFSSSPYTADLFVDAIPPGEILVSSNVGNLNTNFANKFPVGQLQFNPGVDGELIGGVNTALRRVPANETVTSGQISGKIIIAPGNSILFFLTSNEVVNARIGFEWWEGKNIF
ncbi:DUF6143 family protein [Jeotgalibacillus marinus]|uniref:DUF6143 family protein n=1 Tax=Jeotgalibacillus marinus TaxID=86667 RepID=A0ABV3PZ25_9BACL